MRNGCCLAEYNSLKLLNDLDTIERKTQLLHQSDNTGGWRSQQFDTIKKIFIFTQELHHLDLKHSKILIEGERNLVKKSE